MIVYGIPNCNTVQKARAWLTANGFEYTFHDFKKEGITAEKLQEWCSTFGWETVLNKKGTTWRKLAPAAQETVRDENAAIALLLEHNSAIKRPVIELDGKAVLISFNEEQYGQLLNK